MGGSAHKPIAGLFSQKSPPGAKKGGAHSNNVFGNLANAVSNAKSSKNPDPAKPAAAAAAAPDPLVLNPDASKPSQPVAASGAIVPVGSMQTVPAAPAPSAPVTQQMANVTAPRQTPVGAKLEMAGAAGNVQSAAAAPVGPPAATYAGMPPAMQQTAMRPGAAAMGANQISTGANQFMAPSLSGITFGGS